MAVIAEPPPAPAPDAGVIEDARRRQRRHRLGAAALIALAAILAVVLGGGGPHRAPALEPASSPTWLTGPPLASATHLRLIASENTGPAFLVDVDSGTARLVPGLGVPRDQSTTSGPRLFPLTAIAGGALAVVTHQPCARCRMARFVIGADGSARRVAPVTLARHQYTTAPVPGSTATWVLTWPPDGHCTARLEPSGRRALAVPCGRLESDTPAGLVLTRGERVTLIDPRTGRVRTRLRVRGQFDVLGRDVALASTAPGFPGDGSFPTGLRLVDLRTGASTRLRWPSILTFGYRVIAEPHGPLVAVEFLDPAFTPPRHDTIGQAADIWLLDPRTASFTHVPAFPILEHIKFSSVAWAADGRLVIVAQGGALTQPGARTVIGVWRPGQRTIPIRTVPALDGYSQFVPLIR